MMPDDGIAVLHSIGHMSPPGMASPWLRKYIFPGAYSQVLSEVFDAVERKSIWVMDLEFLSIHYATTLAHWPEDRKSVVYGKSVYVRVDLGEHGIIEKKNI